MLNPSESNMSREAAYAQSIAAIVVHCSPVGYHKGPFLLTQLSTIIARHLYLPVVLLEGANIDAARINDGVDDALGGHLEGGGRRGDGQAEFNGKGAHLRAVVA